MSTLQRFLARHGHDLRSVLGLQWGRALGAYDNQGLDYRNMLVLELGQKRLILHVLEPPPQMYLEVEHAKGPLPLPIGWMDDVPADQNPAWREIPLPGIQGLPLEAVCVIGSSASACGPRSQVDRGTGDAWLAGLEFHLGVQRVGVAISTTEIEAWCIGTRCLPWPWPETIIRHELIR